MKGWLTWEELFTYLLIGGALYYAILLFRIYRQQFNNWKQNTVAVKWNREVFQQAEKLVEQDAINKPVSSHHISTDVHELTQELKEVFAAAIRDQLQQEQIMDAIGLRLHQYPGLKDSAFHEAINNHIIMELQSQLSLTVNSELLNKYW